MRIKLGFLFIFLSPFAFANHSYVASWAEKTMMATLSASYKDTPADLQAVEKNFFPGAWWPLHSFFIDKRNEINSRKLVLHPVPLTQPTVTTIPNCELSSRCWRVEEAFTIPEMTMSLQFSLLVIAVQANKHSDSPFLVQSLNMKVYDY